MFNLHADPKIKELKTFFYNEICHKALISSEEIDEENIDSLLKNSIKSLIDETLLHSTDLSDSFRLAEGLILHKGNCPLMYLNFFNALLMLKKSNSDNRAQAINNLVEALINAPGFAEMLPKVKDFILGKIDSKKLKDFFYNRLNELAFMQGNINEQNIDEILEYLVRELIKDILDQSKGYGSTIIFGNEKINLDNCPKNYLDFYNTMAKLNQSGLARHNSVINTGIENIASALINSVAFKLMLPKLKQFILEISVPPQEQLSQSNGSVNSIPQLSVPVAKNVDIESIRHTFYQHMKEQIVNALENGLITVDDLESQEPFLCMGLPGLALLAAIDASSNYVGGLVLSNGAIVDKHNCPKEDSFREFLNALLLCKERVQLLYGSKNTAKLPTTDYQRIQYLCLAKDTPKDLVVQNEVSSTHCATIINGVASKISQNADFQKMVGSVIEEALHRYQSKPTL